MNEPSKDDLADTITATYRTMKEIQASLQFHTDVILGIVIFGFSFAFCYYSLRKVFN